MTDAQARYDQTAGGMMTPAKMAALAAGLTVGALFQQQVVRNGSRIALEGNGRTLAYTALGERVRRLARALAARGIGRGDRIALLSENRPEYLELQLAAATLGVILACQNWRQADPELQHCIRLVAPYLLIASERQAGRLAAIDHGVQSVLRLGEDYEVMLRSAPTGEVPDVAEPEDGLLILYTSGTTGLPKAAVISHRAMTARSVIARTDGSFFPDRTFIAWTPLFHMGATDSALAALMHGAKVVVLESFDPPAIADLLEQEPIGWLSLMPGMFTRMIEELRRKPRRLQPLGLCGAMADLVPRHEIAEITTLLQAPFRNSFGSTETGPAPFSRGRIPIGVAPQRLSKLQSSYCLVRLVDPEGQDVPDGEPGEAAFRGPSLFSGYWGDPAANAETFRSGWYHMGDVLRRNPDSTYDFVDRRKYLIKSGGENIYPAEIEQVLLASPRVAEAVVVRRADPRWGEVPVAFVAPGEPDLKESDVLALCYGKIAGYKVPKAVHFLPEAEFPRSTSGKVQRHLLEVRLQAAMDTHPEGGMMHRRSLFLSAILVPSAVASARSQPASGVPNRPITIVVPFPPGGLSDTMTRALGQRLGQELGQTIVVDNRPGAGTSVASSYVLQSRPDGTTLLMGSNSLATNPTALPQLPPRDPENELAPIGLAYMSAFLLVVRDDFPARDLAGFIAHAKANPGRVNFASSGVGAVNHLALELFNRSAGIALEHIPFRGGAPALIELRAGRVAAFLATPADVAGQLQDGSLRALATTTAQRLEQLPEVPAIAELLPGYEAVYWQALFAPAATPEPVVQRLATALQAVKADAEFRASLAARGVALLPGGPQELRDYLRRETAVWGRIIREANIRLE